MVFTVAFLSTLTLFFLKAGMSHLLEMWATDALE